MRSDARDLRALRWRDLCEAIALSIAFHLLFAVLIFAVQPSLMPQRLCGDLFIHLGEQNQLCHPISDVDKGASLIAIAPGGDSATPFDLAPEPTYGEWMNRMPVKAAQTTPTEQLISQSPADALQHSASSPLHPASAPLHARADAAPKWSQQFMQQLRKEGLSLPAQLPSEGASEAFRLYCSSPAQDALEIKPPKQSAATSPDLPEQVRQTLGWLKVDKAPKEQGLALGSGVAPGIYWEGIAANPAPAGEELANSDNFSVDIKLHRKFAGRGYLFEANFHPKSDVGFQKIGQNYLFLIDRSNSISHTRFAAFKAAVASALETLGPDDRFNIVFFDKRLTKFSPEAISCSFENISSAQSFLQGEKSGGFFASTDLYTSLDRMIPQEVNQEEITSAILLTDGDTHMSREKQRRTIAAWTQKNASKVSLFAVACGRGNNLPLMELLSFFNRGRLSYCAEEGELPNLVKNLLNSLHYPIGKDMLATAVSSDTACIPKILPSNGQLANLQRAGPFSIVGSCLEPGNFYLYLQGRHRKQWLDIKQRVELLEQSGIAEPNFELERRYLILRAFEHYRTYLQTAKTSELRAAKQLLQALGCFSAFH